MRLSLICKIGGGRGCREVCDDGGWMTAGCVCPCHTGEVVAVPRPWPPERGVGS